MQLQTPQFIDIEDKIFGPLTLKQFIYLVGGGGLSFIVWSILPSFIAFIFIPIIIALSAALSFYKVNDKPLISTIESYFQYKTRGKLYIWKKKEKERKKEAEKEADIVAQLYVPKLSESKLKDLTWSLDVQGKIDNLKK